MLICIDQIFTVNIYIFWAPFVLTVHRFFCRCRWLFTKKKISIHRIYLWKTCSDAWNFYVLYFTFRLKYSRIISFKRDKRVCVCVCLLSFSLSFVVLFLSTRAFFGGFTCQNFWEFGSSLRLIGLRNQWEWSVGMRVSVTYHKKRNLSHQWIYEREMRM